MVPSFLRDSATSWLNIFLLNPQRRSHSPIVSLTMRACLRRIDIQNRPLKMFIGLRPPDGAWSSQPHTRRLSIHNRLWKRCARHTGIRCMRMSGGELRMFIRHRILRRNFSSRFWRRNTCRLQTAKKDVSARIC